MIKSRKSYTADFKQETVRLMESSGQPVAQPREGALHDPAARWELGFIRKWTFFRFAVG